MDDSELNALDSAVARVEGFRFTTCRITGVVLRADRTPYMPTRSDEEAAHLIEKYLRRIVWMEDGSWIAIGPNGRACPGPTLPIAVCKAVAELRLSAQGLDVRRSGRRDFVQQI